MITEIKINKNSFDPGPAKNQSVKKNNKVLVIFGENSYFKATLIIEHSKIIIVEAANMAKGNSITNAELQAIIIHELREDPTP